MSPWVLWASNSVPDLRVWREEMHQRHFELDHWIEPEAAQRLEADKKAIPSIIQNMQKKQKR